MLFGSVKRQRRKALPLETYRRYYKTLTLNTNFLYVTNNLLNLRSSSKDFVRVSKEILRLPEASPKHLKSKAQ
jgi:hypothetical protein